METPLEKAEAEVDEANLAKWRWAWFATAGIGLTAYSIVAARRLGVLVGRQGDDDEYDDEEEEEAHGLEEMEDEDEDDED